MYNDYIAILLNILM